MARLDTPRKGAAATCIVGIFVAMLTASPQWAGQFARDYLLGKVFDALWEAATDGASDRDPDRRTYPPESNRRQATIDNLRKTVNSVNSEDQPATDAATLRRLIDHQKEVLREEELLSRPGP